MSAFQLVYFALRSGTVVDARSVAAITAAQYRLTPAFQTLPQGPRGPYVAHTTLVAPLRRAAFSMLLYVEQAVPVAHVELFRAALEVQWRLTLPGEARYGEVARRAVTGRDGQGRAGTGRDGQGRAGTGRDGQGRAGTGRDGQGRAGTGRDGQGRAGTGRGQDASLKEIYISRDSSLDGQTCLYTEILVSTWRAFSLHGETTPRDTTEMYGCLYRELINNNYIT